MTQTTGSSTLNGTEYALSRQLKPAKLRLSAQELTDKAFLETALVDAYAGWLVDDVLENWLRIAKGKRTLLFCVNKTHGAALLAEFLRQGIQAEMLTDQDEEGTRDEVVARFERGETHVLRQRPPMGAQVFQPRFLRQILRVIVSCETISQAARRVAQCDFGDLAFRPQYAKVLAALGS